MELKDLSPREDPKGGTPPPIPVREYEAQRSGDLWKQLAVTGSAILGAAALLVGIGVHLARFDAVEVRIGKIEATIERMNSDGTDYTRWQLGEDKKYHDDVESRLRKLERHQFVDGKKDDGDP